MQYRHAPAANHAALDAVLASAPGRPTLPVRLTVELAGRARVHLPADAPLTVWDPCCGAGATLTVLGLLVPGLARLVGTDADPGPLDLARRNLALLDPGGLTARAADLEALAARHDKPSYAEAATAVRTLVPASAPAWSVTPADARDTAAVRSALAGAGPYGTGPDLVLADLPHGRRTTWAAAADDDEDPGVEFLRAVATALRPDAVVVAVGRGRTVPLPGGARPLERVRVGHRAAVLVRAGALQEG
ncbi:rRNA methyltransferase [Pseudonocardia alni]|uniref:rRNA methyltransferase n=1 Tax=Pseudonocardia alni TaxID=33907 RepID=UPI001AD730F5|nr:rRNA methyltransferase [Pseudonocardia alni]MBO4238447.1 rRNA methyltransferase [Pseudonocardia alni]